MTIPVRGAAGKLMPGPWQSATVLQVRAETANARTFRLRLADPRPHLAGQHYIVRLTAPGGYRAQRSYPVASAPGGDIIELTVEHLPGGEVSGFLHEAVMPGDLAPVLRQGRAAYVCGSPAFCDSVTAMLEHLHVPAARVGVERFGPSG